MLGLLAALSGFAQRLTGTVTTNQPVPFATVAVLNSTLGATAVMASPSLRAAHQRKTYAGCLATCRAAFLKKSTACVGR